MIIICPSSLQDKNSIVLKDAGHSGLTFSSAWWKFKRISSWQKTTGLSFLRTFTLENLQM